MREPVLFVGHGSPMNALANNAYTRMLNALGEGDKPRAILCVSAHWMTHGETRVTAMERPRTIHDFGGFPRALFEVEYPAPGAPGVAEEIVRDVAGVRPDHDWGLDHGAWSILKHMYPRADVPVLQLSLDMTAPPAAHLALGRRLRPLRERGVRIIASGNVVHNLRRIRWEADAAALPFAPQFDGWVRARLQAGELDALATEYASAPGGAESVPTLDHYLPLLYAVGAAAPGEAPHLEYEEIQNASISMLTFSYGRDK